VDSFAFHSPLVSADSNLVVRQLINRKFTADRHCITTDKKEGYAHNNKLPQAGAQCFVGQESIKFGVQIFIGKEVLNRPAFGNLRTVRLKWSGLAGLLFFQS
jgi:hypothetical protein